MGVLDNVFWESLTGPQAAFATGDDRARRYARGFTPIAAFPDPGNPDFEALATLFEPGEPFYTSGWKGEAPPGWRIQLDSHMQLMVWVGRGDEVADFPEAVRLGHGHVEQMLDLAATTRPGPFGRRTIEMGEYYGVVQDGRLLAMAGERVQAAGYREISAVCTHPDARGRGYASRLTAKLIGLQYLRGQATFLHVISDNVPARRMYAGMGFREYAEFPVRVVTRE